jgi:hypothetical protein
MFARVASWSTRHLEASLAEAARVGDFSAVEKARMAIRGFD